jgi:hypothetical protein
MWEDNARELPLIGQPNHVHITNRHRGRCINKQGPLGTHQINNMLKHDTIVLNPKTLKP